MNLLYVYHSLFYVFYMWYIGNNPSDSKGYYDEVSTHTGSWFELFGTDTHFIDFMGYPFYTLGITSFEAMMFLFSWFGFIGFLHAYLFFRENIPIKIKVFNVDFLTLLLFLPNMHFWTVSFAKGSSIFMGLMIFTYAITNFKKRYLILILSSFIIFQIRPHMFMFVAVGAVVGYLSGKAKVPLYQKIGISIGLLVSLLLVQDTILGVVGLQDSENLVQGFENFSERRSEDLSTSSSGVDMQSYPLPVKIFTFWFRPLFIDAPNFMGIIISFENLLYLLLFIKILKKDFVKFLMKSPSFVKMSMMIFLSTSLAMTFIMSNLGIIMRQKSMVMYYLFFVIYYYLAQKKYDKIIKLRQRRKSKLKSEREVLASA
ncbi:hypothetical protein [Autumnicola musiva]|uniref:EpsG family protein n=1 Tax=Autumnicola musiva TaxID=3075589 RepID=A0ABU3D7I4_9FLAO|nr:hypothetical protein [Zunongwangia sp. F117]MDT0677469.1 hypothetical protein [Zunongwangia sp. F117]